jgi:hypothetical protein
VLRAGEHSIRHDRRGERRRILREFNIPRERHVRGAPILSQVHALAEETVEIHDFFLAGDFRLQVA